MMAMNTLSVNSLSLTLAVEDRAWLSLTHLSSLVHTPTLATEPLM